ncbi:heavy-metal-associated domain-containing protein [bacterium]|nr:heavy-metal-associated domain-containing protein [bacterium]
MKHELTLEGMSCGHCVKAVKEALATVDGIEVEHVQIGSAIVESAHIDKVLSEITTVLEDEGYPMVSCQVV